MEEIRNEVPLEVVIVSEQINLLANWNKDNINIDPEQVRKNIETILAALTFIRNI